MVVVIKKNLYMGGGGRRKNLKILLIKYDEPSVMCITK